MVSALFGCHPSSVCHQRRRNLAPFVLLSSFTKFWASDRARLSTTGHIWCSMTGQPSRLQRLLAPLKGQQDANAPHKALPVARYGLYY